MHITSSTKIEYLEDTAGDIPTRILPSTMQSWYTEHFVITKIEGFFKQFSLIQLADLKHRRVTTLLNVFGNKLYYRSKQGELPASVVVPRNLSFRNTQESKVIGGLQSNRVEVDTGEEKFNIYYTEDFSVRRPQPEHSLQGHRQTPFCLPDSTELPENEFDLQIIRGENRRVKAFFHTR
jgi:hypothetical protein